MQTALCFGQGYVGGLWRKALEREDYVTLGTCRHSGEDVLLFDGEHPVPRAILDQASYILSTIPPSGEGDPVLRVHQNDLLAHPHLKWIGYISSTGVYGDHQGRWVDEETPCHPTSITGQQRLRAEQQWLHLFQQAGLPVHIFRCSGIYGPARSMMERIVSGQALRIDAPGHYMSRIHVDDIINVLISSMAHPDPGAIYNLADDEPCASREVIEYVCDQLNQPYPPLQGLGEAELSPMARQFYQDNRRVKNDKIKEELHIKLKYPTYREGYRDLINKLG